MTLFREWYVDKHQNFACSDGQNRLIADAFELLRDNALQQPQVWVHRDYHSRNLMLTQDNNPGILDFQDAVNGPITYDLVSLLRDCYIEWPEQQVTDWALGFHTLALQSGLPVGEDETQFLVWFDLMGVQRHIKVLGIFSRLYYRDRKAHYLEDLALVWKYLVTVCERYPALHGFRDLLLQLRP